MTKFIANRVYDLSMFDFGAKLFLVTSLIFLAGCEGEGGDFDMKMTSLSRTSIGIKSSDSRNLEGCIVLINGAQGFWHEPEKATFKSGESRTFSLVRFYTATKRQFNTKVDIVSSASVTCSKPHGSTVVFRKNQNLGSFLK